MSAARARGRGRGRLHRHEAPTPLDPHGLAAQAERHLAWLEVRAYAETTVQSRRRDLDAFAAWCAERGITRPADLSRLVLDLFQKWLAHLPKKDGAPLSVRSQRLKLLAVAGFCRWLAREKLVLYNPAAELELPKAGRRLPHTILTSAEVERVLAVPDVRSPLGLRDRAIMETFYSTGIRRFELIGLEVQDVDFQRGVLLVRQGKGKKDRVVPIGERALAWVRKYLDEVRPSLATSLSDRTLFLTADGTRLGRNHLTELVRRAIAAADIGKQGSCHLFRHTMATLMLEAGADIRFIQQMLGHARLDTTQIYTQVSIQALKAVHEATHPAARLKHRTSEPPDGWDEARIRIVLDHYESQSEDDVIAEDEADGLTN